MKISEKMSRSPDWQHCTLIDDEFFFKYNLGDTTLCDKVCQ